MFGYFVFLLYKLETFETKWYLAVNCSGNIVSSSCLIIFPTRQDFAFMIICQLLIVYYHNCILFFSPESLFFLCWLYLQRMYYFLYKYVFLKCSPLMVFLKFLIVQHPMHNILNHCFSNQSDFCVHPIFHHNVIPIHTFFLETLFPHPKNYFF